MVLMPSCDVNPFNSKREVVSCSALMSPPQCALQMTLPGILQFRRVFRSNVANEELPPYSRGEAKP